MAPKSVFFLLSFFPGGLQYAVGSCLSSSVCVLCVSPLLKSEDRLLIGADVPANHSDEEGDEGRKEGGRRGGV